MSKEPDLDRLRPVRNDLGDLGAVGTLTKDAFDLLWKQAVEADKGHDACVEGIETSAIWYGLGARCEAGRA